MILVVSVEMMGKELSIVAEARAGGCGDVKWLVDTYFWSSEKQLSSSPLSSDSSYDDGAKLRTKVENFAYSSGTSLSLWSLSICWYGRRECVFHWRETQGHFMSLFKHIWLLKQQTQSLCKWLPDAGCSSQWNFIAPKMWFWATYFWLEGNLECKHCEVRAGIN